MAGGEPLHGSRKDASRPAGGVPREPPPRAGAPVRATSCRASASSSCVSRLLRLRRGSSRRAARAPAGARRSRARGPPPGARTASSRSFSERSRASASPSRRSSDSSRWRIRSSRRAISARRSASSCSSRSRRRTSSSAVSALVTWAVAPVAPLSLRRECVVAATRPGLDVSVVSRLQRPRASAHCPGDRRGQRGRQNRDQYLPCVRKKHRSRAVGSARETGESSIGCRNRSRPRTCPATRSDLGQAVSHRRPRRTRRLRFQNTMPFRKNLSVAL